MARSRGWLTDLLFRPSATSRGGEAVGSTRAEMSRPVRTLRLIGPAPDLLRELLGFRHIVRLRKIGKARHEVLANLCERGLHMPAKSSRRLDGIRTAVRCALHSAIQSCTTTRAASLRSRRGRMSARWSRMYPRLEFTYHSPSASYMSESARRLSSQSTISRTTSCWLRPVVGRVAPKPRMERPPPSRGLSFLLVLLSAARGGDRRTYDGTGMSQARGCCFHAKAAVRDGAVPDTQLRGRRQVSARRLEPWDGHAPCTDPPAPVCP